MTSLVSVKLVLLGNASVGKSSILQRFASEMYSEHKPPTVGAAFTTKMITVNGRQIKYDIWDTAGQEKYRSMTPLYYRGAYCAIVVYDITDNSSYLGAQSWIDEVKQFEGEHIEIALVGNKVDLDKDGNQRQVSREMVEEYAQNNKYIFIETSAKNGIGINDLFQQIGSSIPQRSNQTDNKLTKSKSHIDFIKDDTNFTAKPNENTCC